MNNITTKFFFVKPYVIPVANERHVTHKVRPKHRHTHKDTKPIHMYIYIYSIARFVKLTNNTQVRDKVKKLYTCCWRGKIYTAFTR